MLLLLSLSSVPLLGSGFALISSPPRYECVRRFSETGAQKLADVVEEAVRVDQLVDLRIEKMDDSKVLGRAVLVKKKRKLQLTEKRRGQCDVALNHGDVASAVLETLRGARKATATTVSIAAASQSSRKEEETWWTHTLVVGPPESLVKKERSRGQRSSLSHDRVKQRAVSGDYLSALKVTNANGKTRPGRERKLTQIQRFGELLKHALKDVELPENATVIDMGCGRGYLTFAAHEILGGKARVVGVERRQHLVDEANQIASDLGLAETLSFRKADIAELNDEEGGTSIDVVIALHACDTATDDALFAAVKSQARLILAAPCCHKEIRPQLETKLAQLRKSVNCLSPADTSLLDIASHGVVADRYAEHVTDTMRAVLLETAGYRSKIIEWIGLEHTAKNTMLVAKRRNNEIEADEATHIFSRLLNLATHHGVRRQRLATLMDVPIGDGPRSNKQPFLTSRMPGIDTGGDTTY